MKEIFGSVNYYGIGNIIRNYCGFSKILPLPVSIQHGWYLAAVQHDAKKNAGENWYWSKEIESQYNRKYSDIKTRATGAPFIYHLWNIGYQEMPIEQRKGSIVFPAHSSDFVTVDYNYEKFAAMLDGLPEKYKPITVCIYYIEHEKGMDRFFKEKGFQIVTNGMSLYQSDFLHNYVDNTKDKLYAFSNEPTSALIYASLMGLTAFYFGPTVKEFLVDKPLPAEIKMFEQRKKITNHWQVLFRFPDCDRSKQKEYCDLVAGKDVLLEKKDMRNLLYRILFSRRFLFFLTIAFFARFKLIKIMYRKSKQLLMGNNEY